MGEGQAKKKRGGKRKQDEREQVHFKLGRGGNKKNISKS
jgi:hypothetical protein